MSELSVTKTRIFAGVWEGVVTGGDGAPQIEVSHLEKPVKFELAEPGDAEAGWVLQIPVPTGLLCDGVQVITISEGVSGEKLAAFTIVTGEPLEDDIRSETALLRAELDMLKRAFRRHCLETS